jgi:hypothetical protein
MRATLNDIDEKPVHPDQDPEVQQAKAAWLEADRSAVAAQRKNDDNHRQLVTAADDVDRWRAQAAAPGLLSAMLEAKANAKEAGVHYEALRKERMKPIEQYWRQRHQAAVEQLCDALSEASRKNAAVLAIIKQAGDEGVQLSMMSSLWELEPQHCAFTCMKLRENV